MDRGAPLALFQRLDADLQHLHAQPLGRKMLIAPAAILMPQTGANAAVANAPSPLRLFSLHLGTERGFDGPNEIDDDARLLAIGGEERERLRRRPEPR